ncbi:MAG: hypothetical protein AB1521_16755 [Bacteroidota bacterium]
MKQIERIKTDKICNPSKSVLSVVYFFLYQASSFLHNSLTPGLSLFPQNHIILRMKILLSYPAI